MAVARLRSKRQERIDELKQVLLARFPDAKFRVTPAPDAPRITALWTYTSADLDEVADAVRDREFEIMVEDGIQIIAIPMLPEEYRS
ncbi:MAG: hypothetical protein Q7T33_15085 [Dehalococcoidia bacterium]|nr:hypothetical protein [Dehalococcoidia bacterium]